MKHMTFIDMQKDTNLFNELLPPNLRKLRRQSEIL